MPGKRSSFTLPVEPISPPPKPAAAAPWIAPSATGLGGGAGYRPRVRRAYFDTVYRHSRARRRRQYKPYGALFKAENQPAIRPAARAGIVAAARVRKPRTFQVPRGLFARLFGQALSFRHLFWLSSARSRFHVALPGESFVRRDKFALACRKKSRAFARSPECLRANASVPKQLSAILRYHSALREPDVEGGRNGVLRFYARWGSNTCISILAYRYQSVMMVRVANVHRDGTVKFME